MTTSGVACSRTPMAYPVFDLEYEADRQRLEDGALGVDRLVSIGRNGEFAHILMEDVYWRTIRRARQLAAELQTTFVTAA